MSSVGVKREVVDLVALLGAAGVDPDRSYVERREERRPASWIAMIRLPSGEEIPSSVKDISASGARLAVPERYRLPPTFSFRVIGKEFVLQARLAWRRDDYAGVEILRVGRLPKPAAGNAERPPAPPPEPPSSAPRPEGTTALPSSRMRTRVLTIRR